MEKSLPVETLIRRARGSLPAALLKRFIDANLLSQSAALAFYALLSLAPLLLILLWLTASLLPSAREALLSQIGSLGGSDTATVARIIVANAEERPDTGSVAGLWSLGLLFVGATVVFGQLQDVLNRIFRTDAHRLPGIRAWLRKRVFSFGLVLALGFLLVISMTVNTALQLALSPFEWILPLMAAIVSWAIYALAFALMFHYLPDRRVGWLYAFFGGAFTASLFALGRWVIGWYLQGTNPGAAYGAMGVLVLTLFWVYYAGLILFVGALVTAVVDERHRARRSGTAATAERGAPGVRDDGSALSADAGKA
jgi:membrane protein